jgi:hypothetical protein
MLRAQEDEEIGGKKSKKNCNALILMPIERIYHPAHYYYHFTTVAVSGPHCIPWACG